MNFKGVKMRPLLFVLVAFAITAMSYSVNPDIPYYPDGTAPNPPKNMLDVYVPSGITEPAPVLFFVHGGTWTYGDRRDFSAVGAYLSDQEGYVVVVISYSLSDSLHPEVSHPDHIVDVAQAFSWTVNNIADYGGNPDRIIVMGHSAGGHLASLLATNTRFLDSVSVGIEAIKAVVSFNMGIYDIPKLYRDCGAFGSVGYGMMGFSAIFGPIADSSFNWYDASPKYHLSAHMPPFIFFVSTLDMEQIIGGDFGGFGVLILPGEVQFTYNDFRAFQPADTFWLEGDHNSAFSDFVFDRLSRGRILTMAFLNDVLYGVDEQQRIPDEFSLKISPNPFNAAVRIDLSLPAKVDIFDISGRMVTSLRKNISAESSMIWTPDESVGSGVYLVRASCDSREVSRTVVLMK